MDNQNITDVEHQWLSTMSKIYETERELFLLRDHLRAIKPQVLDGFGFRGARDELLTAMILEKQ